MTRPRNAAGQYARADRPETDRDVRILAAAHDIAVLDGLSALTRERIARTAGLSPASVSNFQQWSLTRDRQGPGGPIVPRVVTALLERAVTDGDLRLVAMGLAAQHPVCLAAPYDLRVAALTAI